MKIYSYFRSSAAYRLRLALALKGLSYDAAYVHLRKKEHRDPAYLAMNPQGLVPVLVDDDNSVITQSLAQIEYLEETRPNPPLLPKDAAGRARVRALALLIACDIHPINNLRVLMYLKDKLGVEEAARDDWYRHWVMEGFASLEQILREAKDTDRFCHGDTPGLADVFLVPQMYNARRFDVDVSAYPTISRINDAVLALPAVKGTAPGEQPDAE